MDTKRRAGSSTANDPRKTDQGYAWFHDGSMPQTSEDLIAEAVALVALLFSLCIGLVIATLPVSVNATAAAATNITAHPAAMSAHRLQPASQAAPGGF